MAYLPISWRYWTKSVLTKHTGIHPEANSQNWLNFHPSLTFVFRLNYVFNKNMNNFLILLVMSTDMKNNKTTFPSFFFFFFLSSFFSPLTDLSIFLRIHSRHKDWNLK